MTIIAIDAKARQVPKIIKTLCGTCRNFASDCNQIEKETKIRGGYLIVTQCNEYREETLTTKQLKRAATKTV